MIRCPNCATKANGIESVRSVYDFQAGGSRYDTVYRFKFRCRECDTAFAYHTHGEGAMEVQSYFNAAPVAPLESIPVNLQAEYWREIALKRSAITYSVAQSFRATVKTNLNFGKVSRFDLARTRATQLSMFA